MESLDLARAGVDRRFTVGLSAKGVPCHRCKEREMTIQPQKCTMNVNKETNIANDDRLNFEQGHHFENRWEEDRRREPGEGFTYISTVGWIDRRERLRRKDDSMKY
jgi:hypothetical protein